MTQFPISTSTTGAIASQTFEASGDASTGTSITTANVSLRSVTKKYGSFVAVENITLEIPSGSYCCLLGPSGCGKTTTMRMIAGHEEITQGEIYIGDRLVNNFAPAKRSTSMMFQNYALFPHKTVWQNVEFGMRMRGVPKSERHQRVDEMLEIVGLGRFAHRKPAQLSGGQQQRVALARALVTRPQVLLLDEPLSALDENLRVKTRGELRKLQQQFGMTFIQVTHNHDEAYSLADMVVVMDHGRIDQVGTPQDIFAKPISQFVANFTADNNIFVGKVTRAVEDNPGYSVQLDVDGLGAIVCKGDYAQVGAEAACSVRADRIYLDTNPHQNPQLAATNQFAARIRAVEFTGYVTRVYLVLELTGQEILYKARTTDWAERHFHDGQSVLLRWSVEDCVFLPH